MNLEQTDALVGLVISVCVLGGILVGWAKWLRPRYRRNRDRFVSAMDSLVGRDAVYDSITGKEIAPALPGMGVRMAQQEQQMQVLTDAVAKIAESHERLDDHERRLHKLEVAAVERVVTRAESAEAWRAIAAVAETQPPDADTPPELD